MDKLGEVLKIIIDNFGYLFGIDFLSLFVSGATCLSAFAFVWIQLTSINALPELFSTQDGKSVPQGLIIAVIVLACYALGMICFAFGRWVRTTLFEQCQKLFRRLTNYQKSPTRSPAFMRAVLEDHALSEQGFVRKYLEPDDSIDEARLSEISYQVGFEEKEIRSLSFARQNRIYKHGHFFKKGKDSDPTGRLYTRLWAEVRQSPDLTASYTLLNRYWFMAATYDGLATALIVWAIAVTTWSLGWWGNNKSDLSLLNCVGVCGAFVFLAITCWREADRYARYQLEELIATVAYKERKLKSDKESLMEQ